MQRHCSRIDRIQCVAPIEMQSHRACVVLIALLQCQSAQSLRPVRAISLDITGTLITHKGSVVQHYVDAAVWARLKNPPSVDEMKPAFKEAYKERCLASPCFGGAEGISGRDWWRCTARRVMELCGRSYAEDAFERWFRSVHKSNAAALHAIDATPDRQQPTH